MNLQLYNSSLQMFIIHLIKCTYTTNIIFQMIFITGCITSMLNHRFTNKYLKYLDRLTISLLLMVDMVFMNNFKVLLPLSVLLYFYSKYTDDVKYHIYAHRLLTYFHLVQS